MEKESELLFDKRYTCPICEKEFKVKNVKTGKAKFIDTDMDLRPIYQNIDVLKYDVVLCPECGYASLPKYFDSLSNAQIDYIKENIGINFKKREINFDYYTYDMAIDRYKLALLSSVVKKGIASEIGYVCLKLSWILQNKADYIEKEKTDTQNEQLNCQNEASSFSVKALDYLTKARMEEDYPICGMDEPTLDYLLAALAVKADRLDFASKMLGGVASSREASDRLKDKAYDLKNIISEKNKEQN